MQPYQEGTSRAVLDNKVSTPLQMSNGAQTSNDLKREMDLK
jgi:hypothetical protein